MSLPTLYFQPAFWTAVALAAVATDADCERVRQATRRKPKAQHSLPVDIHLSHFEIISSDRIADRR
jgi:hypothetical protein